MTQGNGVCIVCGGPAPLTEHLDDILVCNNCEQHTPERAIRHDGEQQRPSEDR
jgi:hypothetical protein